MAINCQRLLARRSSGSGGGSVDDGSGGGATGRDDGGGGEDGGDHEGEEGEGMRGRSERKKGAWSNENCASDRQVTCESGAAKRSPLFLTRALTEEALFDSSRSEGDTIARYGMIISCFMVTMLTIGVNFQPPDARIDSDGHH